ncbi:MAG: DUF4405 domain-containing protein [Desulfobacterales bacterium]|jgi:hypothetical protein
MALRRTASLTAFLSFALTGCSAVVLYLAPQGRVAYWSDWRFLGLTKSQWGDLHINVGLLFLLAAGLHIFYNWRPIVAYLKNQSRQIRVFTPAFNAAFLLTTAVAAGTYFDVPPMAWVLDGNVAAKASAADRFGEPPYGHAELSGLKGFIDKAGLSAPAALAALDSRGIRYDSDRQSVLEIARLNGMSPKAVYEAMTAAPKGNAALTSLPDSPPPGTGRKTFSEMCKTAGIAEERALAVFQSKGIDASSELTLKAIADMNGLSPLDIYDIFREAALSDAPPG